MKKPECTVISNSNSVHLQQIFNGFNILYKKGALKLKVEKRNFSGLPGNKPIAKVIVNDHYHIIYDILDGYNYDDSKNSHDNFSILESLMGECDFYYKRSFSSSVSSRLIEKQKMLPLGVNLIFSLPEQELFIQKKINGIDFNQIKKNIRTRNFFKFQSSVPVNLLNLPRFEDLEYRPTNYQEPKILFIPRLWNPEDFQSSFQKNYTDLNHKRIELVKRLKNEFQNCFIGGVVEDEYAKKVCPELCVSLDKKKYLELMHSASICIATEGLHSSIGWKFAEYLVASKCILTEKLNYELPGTFNEGINYFDFSAVEECIEKAIFLLNNPEEIKLVMRKNLEYTQGHLQPEIFVSNTLKICN